MAKKEKTTPEAAPQDEQSDMQTDQTKSPEQAQDASEATAEDSLKQLEEQLAAEKEKFLRLAAEYDNFRKRTVKEKEELNAQCKSTVIRELLPVIDNLDRALEHQTDNLEEYKKGVEMIGKQFDEALKKLHVEPFGAAGDPFDPNLHNAVMHVEDEAQGESVVSAVFAKGYRMGEKVIRPAMVQVAN